MNPNHTRKELETELKQANRRREEAEWELENAENDIWEIEQELAKLDAPDFLARQKLNSYLDSKDPSQLPIFQ